MRFPFFKKLYGATLTPSGALLPASQPVVKLSKTTGHAMQIYNCLGQLRQL